MRKWLPLAAICAGTFMLLVDVTIVNVALPALAADLKTSFSSLQWVVDAYALTLAALVLGIGSIGDRIGHRTTFIAGLTLFAISSLACGFASGAGLLIAARAVQGIGGAAMFATTFPLLNSSYSGRDRGTAYGVWGAVAGASAAVGPVLGGVLTESLSWRWIFFVNPPVSILVIALCRHLGGERPDSRTRVDVPGIVTLTAAAAAATYGMIRAGEYGWATVGSWGLLIAAAVLVGVFVLIERRTTEPMLDLRLLRNRTFSGMLLAGLALNFAAFAYFVYTSIWLQSVLRMSPIDAGLVSVPLSLMSFVVAGGSGRALHTARPGRVIGIGLILIGVGGLTGLALVHGSAGWPQLIAGFAIVGVGVGLVSPMLGAATTAAVPRERAGMAGGAVNMMRQLGYAFGVALLGTVFASRAAAELSRRGLSGPGQLARALAGGQAEAAVRAAGPAGASVSSALHAASLSGLQGAFLVAGLAGIIAGLVVLALVQDPGQSHPSAGQDHGRTGEPVPAAHNPVPLDHVPAGTSAPIME